MNGFGPLFVRELKRLVRQPARLVGTLGAVVLLWIVLGGGFARSFVGADDAGYGAYLVPGMALLVVVFGSMFGAIGLIQERQAGWLHAVLASPAGAGAVMGAKIAAGALVGTAQAGLVLAMAWVVAGPAPGAVGFAAALGGAALAAVLANGACLAMAWRARSVAGFHGVINLVLGPAWMLSGAVFPLDGSAGWLRALATANPLTYPAAVMRNGVGLPSEPVGGMVGGIGSGWEQWGAAGVSVLVAVGAAGVAIGAVRRTAVGPAEGAAQG